MKQNTHSKQVEELIKHLPVKLRRYVRDDVLATAIDRNYISVNDDWTLHWVAGGSTLLAYFCGKMWCGDYGKHIRRSGKTVWKSGMRHFPASELGRLFGIDGMKQIRYNRRDTALPECWQLIDELFDSPQK